MARVVGAPLVNVVGHHRRSTQFQSTDAEDAGAGAAVEDVFVVKVHRHEVGTDHAGSLVRTRSEGLMSIDFDRGERSCRASDRRSSGEVSGKRCVLRQVAPVVDYQRMNISLTTYLSPLTTNNNRFEALLFPLLVPVTIFRFAYIIYYFSAFDGEGADGSVERLLVEE